MELGKDGTIVRTTLEGSGHFVLELLHAGSHKLGCLMVQGIIRVGVIEQEVKSKGYCVQVEYRLPVSSENVQAHITLHIDVRVIDLSVAVALWCFMRVTGWDCDSEIVSSTIP